MKLLTTIAAVLISISAFSQNFIEYDKGTFTHNGEELSMQQIDDLTLLHQAGRGDFRRGINFDEMHKNEKQLLRNNIVRFTGGAATGFFGGVGVLISGILIGDLIWNGRFSDASLGPTAIVTGATTYFCVVSYKAFSRIAISKKGCLRKRDKQFYKVAGKLNEAIVLAGPTAQSADQ